MAHTNTTAALVGDHTVGIISVLIISNVDKVVIEAAVASVAGSWGAGFRGVGVRVLIHRTGWMLIGGLFLLLFLVLVIDFNKLLKCTREEDVGGERTKNI